jgi:flagellar biosynthetic protein FliR
MLATLSDSFQSFPISLDKPLAEAFRTMAEWGSGIFSHALQLSLPLIGALLITNLALGILTRSAPQLNIFAVGFPITLAVGFATLALLIPYLAMIMDHITHDGLDVMARIAQQMGRH